MQTLTIEDVLRFIRLHLPEDCESIAWYGVYRHHRTPVILYPGSPQGHDYVGDGETMVEYFTNLRRILPDSDPYYWDDEEECVVWGGWHGVEEQNKELIRRYGVSYGFYDELIVLRTV